MSIGLLFSGQGAQRVGMGHSLYQQSALARSLWQEANSVLGLELTKVCFEGPEEILTQTKICQPALYVQGYILFQLLKEKKKIDEIGTAFGLSLGELTALATAGVYDFKTGLRIVAERGRLMQMACEQTHGSMTSLIGGEHSQVEALCAEFDVEMANLNCPGQIVVSGASDRIEAMNLKAKGMSFKMVVPLKVAGAYHSKLMLGASNSFEAFLKNISFNKPEIPVLTNTTGESIQDPQAIKQALVKQIIAPVQWEKCVRSAIAMGINRCYECGPGGVLAGLIKRIDKTIPVVTLSEFNDFELVAA